MPSRYSDNSIFGRLERAVEVFRDWYPEGDEFDYNIEKHMSLIIQELTNKVWNKRDFVQIEHRTTKKLYTKHVSFEESTLSDIRTQDVKNLEDKDLKEQCDDTDSLYVGVDDQSYVNDPWIEYEATINEIRHGIYSNCQTCCSKYNMYLMFKPCKKCQFYIKQSTKYIIRPF